MSEEYNNTVLFPGNGADSSLMFQTLFGAKLGRGDYTNKLEKGRKVTYIRSCEDYANRISRTVTGRIETIYKYHFVIRTENGYLVSVPIKLIAGESLLFHE